MLRAVSRTDLKSVLAIKQVRCCCKRETEKWERATSLLDSSEILTWRSSVCMRVMWSKGSEGRNLLSKMCSASCTEGLHRSAHTWTHSCRSTPKLRSVPSGRLIFTAFSHLFPCVAFCDCSSVTVSLAAQRGDAGPHHLSPVRSGMCVSGPCFHH